ncbi:11S globulin seed storage protein 2-like protein [Tanacetum coccineum]
MKSLVAGYTSVFRAMPLEVITNSYEISPSQAQNLKTNKETESILLSPQWTSQQRTGVGSSSSFLYADTEDENGGLNVTLQDTCFYSRVFGLAYFLSL